MGAGAAPSAEWGMGTRWVEGSLEEGGVAGERG